MTTIDSRADLARIQKTIANPLPPVSGEKFAGIIGDRPSQSAKSPSIWNPVFKALDLPVTYLAFDVDLPQLAALIQVLRDSDGYIGGNVTMPYKVAVMAHLDEIDPKARDIGAVNTIVRTADGALVGYNTDGQGALDSLTSPLPGEASPAIADLDGKRVLMIGAGGAARAIGFYLAEALGRGGRLDISNRDAAKGRELAGAVDRKHHNCRFVESFGSCDYELVVNASTVGQSGIRRLGHGTVTCLEPFSPLAPADAPVFAASSAGDDRAFYLQWGRMVGSAIGANNAASFDVMTRFPADAVIFDIIFSPIETVLLRHGRWTGHRVLNGKGMNVRQAVDGFFSRVCRRLLEQRGLHTREGHERVLASMYSAW